MRFLFILAFLLQVGVFAQPGAPAFCFVLAEQGDVLRPLERAVIVLQGYNERIAYVGYSGSWLKPGEELILNPYPLFRTGYDQWMVYHPLEGHANSHVLLISGKDTMRIDLPEDPRQLIDRAWNRRDRDTPEVIRFNKGHYMIEDLIAKTWSEDAAKHLAERLIAEEDAAYKKQLAEQEEYYRQLPPPPPAPYSPPPPMTEEQWAAEQAKQPGLQKVDVERVSGDTVWLSITGRVMLDGGCASGMPLFGVEMLTNTGWVHRIPFSMTQMDCGMPWADWTEQLVKMPPLRWWIGAHQPEGKKDLESGSYRLFFIGGNGKEVRTKAFRVD
jgi:hypothetical protein